MKTQLEVSVLESEEESPRVMVGLAGKQQPCAVPCPELEADRGPVLPWGAGQH